MSKIGLFFAPEGGSVEKVAKKVAEIIGNDKVEVHSIQKTDVSKLNEYTKIIMGISTVGRDTWDNSYSKIGWDLFIPKMDDVDLTGKTIAIFGLGNHILYPDNFVDSMGVLAKKVVSKGGKLIGQTAVDSYDFGDSGAIIDGVFAGLPVDEDNENELTDERVQNWIARIKGQLGF